jgi:hypothetical protein
VEPNLTAVAWVNPVPVIVTEVPAVRGPLAGARLVMVGAYENLSPATILLVPLSVVTLTSISEPVPAGDLTVILVGETTTTLVPGVAPNATVDPATNPVPVIVTAVPPAAAPPAGVMPVTVGTPIYVNLLVVEFALVPPVVAAVTLMIPAACAGEVAVSFVADVYVTVPAAEEPKLTVDAGVNPVPVIVTTVPPVMGPLVGTIPVTAGTYANLSFTDTALVPLGVMTVTSTTPAPGGDLTVIVVLEDTTREVPAVVPNRTDVAPVKSLPVIVTAVPPAPAPLIAERWVSIGAGGRYL